MGIISIRWSFIDDEPKVSNFKRHWTENLASMAAANGGHFLQAISGCSPYMRKEPFCFCRKLVVGQARLGFLAENSLKSWPPHRLLRLLLRLCRDKKSMRRGQPLLHKEEALPPALLVLVANMPFLSVASAPSIGDLGHFFFLKLPSKKPFFPHIQNQINRSFKKIFVAQKIIKSWIIVAFVFYRRRVERAD